MVDAAGAGGDLGRGPGAAADPGAGDDHHAVGGDPGAHRHGRRGGPDDDLVLRRGEGDEVVVGQAGPQLHHVPRPGLQHHVVVHWDPVLRANGRPYPGVGVHQGRHLRGAAAVAGGAAPVDCHRRLVGHLHCLGEAVGNRGVGGGHRQHRRGGQLGGDAVVGGGHLVHPLGVDILIRIPRGVREHPSWHSEIIRLPLAQLVAHVQKKPGSPRRPRRFPKKNRRTRCTRFSWWRRRR
mmetsp:Transcript_8471/g.18557  ORF Transcript_8471/g.18557 Transcript_8471/m.18557 type:complete len:236 (+) Transcript_8471:848-1555(+)